MADNIFKLRDEISQWLEDYARENWDIDFYDGQTSRNVLAEALITEWNITREES